MWTKENRGRYDRSRLRYPSDLTEEEWALVEPLITPAKRGGNKRTVDVREVVNGLMYVLSTGCQWRAIPKDLPPRSTVHDYFDLWAWDGTFDRMHHALYVQCRELANREPSPSAAIIDSQSVKECGKRGLTRMATMRERSDNEDVALRSRARSATSSPPEQLPRCVVRRTVVLDCLESCEAVLPRTRVCPSVYTSASTQLVEVTRPRAVRWK
jgi:transposase